MATYVLMTKLSPEITKSLKAREAIGKQWKKTIEEKCPDVKWICHFALLGPYDFLDIYEAPDEEIAAKVSMLTLASGALQAESWTAIPYKRFIKLIEEL